MTDDRRRIDVLLERVQDIDLRSKLAAEVAEMTAERKFGLVFERHLPEAIRIPDAPVRYGATVQFRDGDDRLWQVKRLRGKTAVLVRDDEQLEAPVSDLIVARKLGDPVYPGFRPLGTIERGGDKPHHLVIEGENFHALQTLQYTHAGKIDLIYIDPPYNTGAGDWIYNDRYIGDSDAYSHSKWLSFMLRRLELAKQLLAPTGVIIAAIDDNEHHRLRMLLDRVFGERNFIANVVWQGGRKNNVKFVADTHDYMLIYARDKAIQAALPAWQEARSGYDELLQAGKDAWEESDRHEAKATELLRKWRRSLPADHPARAERGLNMYDQVDGHPLHAGKVYSTGDLRNPFPRPNLQYDILHPVDGKPVKMHPNGWIWSRERMMQAIEDGLVVFAPTSAGSARQKRFLDAGSTQSVTPVFTQDRSRASRALEAVLGSKDFPFPKDVDVLARWVSIATRSKPDAVILDFFAGTGTTAEAVATLNAEDGGRRQAIVVTNNELSVDAAKRLRKAGHAPGDAEWEAEGVFQKVTRPRVETVVTGVRRDGSVFSEGFEENVAFLDLTYLDRDDVELGEAYRQVAELLWVKAGAIGSVITDLSGEYAIADHYAVLFDVNAWARFADEVGARPEVEVVFIVAGSATSYGTAKRALPETTSTYHLYENYLSNFEINTGENL